MTRWGTEARVGMFVLAALVVLLGFVLVLGDVRFSPTYRVYADFGFTGALQLGAPVQLSGVRVGRVVDLDLLTPDVAPPRAEPMPVLGQSSEPVVRVTLALDAQAKPMLGQGATYAVSTQGLIGETYIEAIPSMPAQAASAPDGSAVRGIDAARLHQTTLQIAALAEFANGLASGASTSVSGQSLLQTISAIAYERRTELSSAIADSAHAIADARALLQTVRENVSGSDVVPTLLGDARATAHVLRQELPGLLQQTRTSLADLSRLMTKADTALDADVVRATLHKTHQAAEQLESLAALGKSVLTQVDAGQGTVGGLLKDPQIYFDLKELMTDLKRHPWKILWRK